LRNAWLPTLLLALALAGCVCPPSAAPASDPARSLLASFIVTQSAFKGPIPRKTGFEFYVVATPPGLVGPLLEGRELRDGKVVDDFDWGSAPSEVEAIERVGLEPFDFGREIAEATERARKQALARGEAFVHGTRDGAEWEIVIVTKAGRFNLRAWNPVADVNSLAPYSANLAKLKTVIDLLAQYYGRLKMGL
jgi:hypothetical protein